MGKLCKLMFATLLSAAVITSCKSANSNEDEVIDSSDTLKMNTYDLALYELKGHPHHVKRTTYFDVSLDSGRFEIDTLGTNVVSTTIHFSPDGSYRAKEHEVIKRDSVGRIIYWRNRRPNVGKVPVGFASDGLEYTYVNDNHMVTDGMGAFSVIVYDDDAKIVGQHTISAVNRLSTSAFNIYRKFDDHDNWTERVTVWTTQGAKDSIPGVNYSIDRREITYYKVK